MLLTMVVVILLNGEPDRFLGGANPTAASVPGPVDATPSQQACSTLTLKQASKCFFDGRPTVPETDAAKRKQAKDNIELAKSVGKGLCSERLSPVLDPKEQARRMTLCQAGTTRAAMACSLEGAEVLLDSEGRFSTLARGCYDELATALQTADVPVSQPEPAPQPPSAAPKLRKSSSI